MKNWYRVYDQCSPCEQSYYVCICDSGSFVLSLGWTQSFRMTGPPYLPIIPIPVNNTNRIYVMVEPQYDSLYHYLDAPEFAIRSKGSNDLIKPSWIDTSGRKSYLRYRYLFNIRGYSPDTLEIVFQKNYHGCELPVVTFSARKTVEYDPLAFPDN